MIEREEKPKLGVQKHSEDKGKRVSTKAEVYIYTAILCPFCHRAKRLLSQKGITFTEIDVTLDQTRRAEMTRKSKGRTTVPQIFLGEQHIGDCEEIHALEREGKLDVLIHVERS